VVQCLTMILFGFVCGILVWISHRVVRVVLLGLLVPQLVAFKADGADRVGKVVVEMFVMCVWYCRGYWQQSN